MSGYAAFALCGPKNVRDICPDKAKPAPDALHTAAQTLSLQPQHCDARAVHGSFCVLQMCVALLSQKSGTCLREMVMTG